jgi:hypothetical protein
VFVEVRRAVEVVDVEAGLDHALELHTQFIYCRPRESGDPLARPLEYGSPAQAHSRASSDALCAGTTAGNATASQ